MEKTNKVRQQFQFQNRTQKNPKRRLRKREKIEIGKGERKGERERKRGRKRGSSEK